MPLYPYPGNLLCPGEFREFAPRISASGQPCPQILSISVEIRL